jgi:hypothetical protein
MHYVKAAAVILALGSGTAAAQGQQNQQQNQQRNQTQQRAPAEGELVAERVTLTATVENIDTKNRVVTLKNKQGNQIRVEVPQSVGSLDAIKKGDRVTVDFYQSLALLLKKPADKEHAVAGEAAVAARTPAPLPGGIVAHRVAAVVEITKVDRQNRQVTVRGPNGQIDTIHVDPAMEVDLAKLKKGDKIKAEYTEAVAISVAPQKNKGT